MPSSTPKWEETEAVPTWEESSPIGTQTITEPARKIATQQTIPSPFNYLTGPGFKQTQEQMGAFGREPLAEKWKTATTSVAPLPRFEVKQDDTFIKGLAKESANQLIGLPEFMFTTPAGIATAGVGPLAGKVGGTAIRLGYLADTIYNFLRQAPNDVEAFTKATPGEKGAMIARWMGTGALAGTLAAPEISRVEDAIKRAAPILPRAAAAAEKAIAEQPAATAAQPEVTPNASKVASPEGVPQPEVRAQVGQETPLRQQGQPAPAGEAQAQEATVEPSFEKFNALPGDERARVEREFGKIPTDAELASKPDLRVGTPSGEPSTAEGFPPSTVEAKAPTAGGEIPGPTKETPLISDLQEEIKGLEHSIDKLIWETAGTVVEEVTPEGKLKARTVPVDPQKVKLLEEMRTRLRAKDAELESALKKPQEPAPLSPEAQKPSPATAAETGKAPSNIYEQEKRPGTISPTTPRTVLSEPGRASVSLEATEGVSRGRLRGQSSVSGRGTETRQELPSERAISGGLAKEIPQKSVMIGEILGPEPSYLEGRLKHRQQVKEWNKLTKDELWDRLQSKRDEDKRFAAISEQSGLLFPELEKLAKESGSKWRTILRDRAKEEGIDNWNPPTGTRGEVTAALARRIAERRLSELPSPVPPEKETEAKPAEAKAETAPAAAAKVQSEVAKVARTEGQRPAKEVKTELVDKIEKAIETATSEFEMAKIVNKLERDPTIGEMLSIRDQVGTIDINIPGDGNFKIKNTKEALSEVLARAKKIKTSSQPSSKLPTGAVQSSTRALYLSAKENAGKKPTPPPESGKGPATLPTESVASDWTSATAEPTELHAGLPIPKALQFANRKMSQLDEATTLHSGKVQKSFDEARRAQREIKKAVPTEQRQAAISVWREAGGDIPTLQSWAAAAKGKMFKQAAIDAQTLTPEEIAIANKAIAAFQVLEARGNRFDVLNSHRDNYIPHVWDVKPPGHGVGFGSGMLKQRFKFSKARTFNNFFEGDQAGFIPKTLSIGKLLPAYIHEMNRVIADRQLVADIVNRKGSDGRDLAVPTGNVTTVDDSGGKAVLVKPQVSRVPDTTDYRQIPNQPALAKWTWEGKDTDGKPVFVRADLALHPEAYRRINSIIGQSALRSWYHDPAPGLAQVPRAVLRGLDYAQSAMKREMFGLLAPFHQVQEGTHAIGHVVNPFYNIPKIDMRRPDMMDAANHGLMLLPDRTSARVYLEGVGTQSSLTSQTIRKAGPIGRAISDVIDGYQDYLFHQYIPGLKFKTYEALLGRNMKLYADELSAGTMTPADVKITSAEQANAAYGHLNYALLDRNPTIQHIIQLAALAPDFLEARTRFAGQAVKGLTSKVGHEQFKAIAILAAVQAGSAFVLSNLLGATYDPKHPFEVIYKGRRYSMRSVPEDTYNLLKDTHQFIYSRVNPLTVKGTIQLLTGLNYRGEKVSSLDTMEELLAGYIPITARAIPVIRSLTETSRQNPVSPLQQLAGSLGLRVSRYSPISETYKRAGAWMDSQKIDRSKGSYPVSKYQQLRYALEDGDMDRAKGEYMALAKTMTPSKIDAGFRQSMRHPFTDSAAHDVQFAASLKGYDRQLYDQALRTRQQILNAFSALPNYR